MSEKTENIIESTPRWLISFYVHVMQALKRMLAFTGLLEKLDKRAKSEQHFHYLRSLLAIHQLEDMIQLDIPWWTYDAIQAIEQHIQRCKDLPTVFEYGSGASTIWLAKRCGKVISVEHDIKWYENLKGKLADYPHVELMLVPPQHDNAAFKYHSAKFKNFNFTSYVTTIEKLNQMFDIIIIDGRSREACLQTCLPFLKPNGRIVFDNANRKRYQDVLAEASLHIQRFYGRVPGSPFKSETAILKR